MASPLEALADTTLTGPANERLATLPFPSPIPPPSGEGAPPPPLPEVAPSRLLRCGLSRPPTEHPVVDATLPLNFSDAGAGSGVASGRLAERVRRLEDAAAAEDAPRLEAARRRADPAARCTEPVPGTVALRSRAAVQLCEVDAVWHESLLRSGRMRRDQYGVVVVGTGAAAWGAVEALLYRRRALAAGTRVLVFDPAGDGGWTGGAEAAAAAGAQMHDEAAALVPQCVAAFGGAPVRVGEFTRGSGERLGPAGGSVRLVVGELGTRPADTLVQVTLALSVLARGGKLVLRAGPALTRLAVGLLYVLARHFRRVHAYRPVVDTAYGEACAVLVCDDLVCEPRPKVVGRLFPMLLDAARDEPPELKPEREDAERLFVRTVTELRTPPPPFAAFVRAFNDTVLKHAETRLQRLACALADAPYMAQGPTDAEFVEQMRAFGLGESGGERAAEVPAPAPPRPEPRPARSPQQPVVSSSYVSPTEADGYF